MSLSVGFLHTDGITFNEWADRAGRRGAINYHLQSIVAYVPVSSKEMYNILENGVWKLLGSSRSIILIQFQTMLQGSTDVFSMQSKQNNFFFSPKMLCKENISIDIVLFICQCTRSFSPLLKDM